MVSEKKTHEKYLSILFIIAIIVITFLMLRPFLTTIISAILLTYIFFPVYRRLNKIFKNKNMSSFITCALIILVFIIPLGLIASSLVRESISTYSRVSNFIDTTNVNLDVYSGYLQEKFGFKFDLGATISNFFNFFIKQLQNFLVSLPQKILNLFILLFLMYYMFKEGEKISKGIKRFIPFKRIYKDELVKEVEDITHAVVYGYVITALAQATVGTLGLFIFGVKGALVWGFIMFFLSLLPYIGPPFVWVPASFYLLIRGVTEQSPNFIGRGIGLFIYGVLIISTIDNIIRPKVIGSRAKINPAIILLGVVGGMALFGIVGIILGPLILSLFFTTLKIYEERK
jgi:predicted PurR-regulated permease PerM